MAMRAVREGGLGAAALLALLASGCPPPPRPESPLFPVVPMEEAVRRVNENCRGLDTGLQALGTARLRFVDDEGRTRTFDLDANLLTIAPRHLRLDFHALGQTQVLFGSNERTYWLHVKPEIDTYWHGSYGRDAPSVAGGIPIRPDMIVEALGINPIPVGTNGAEAPLPRVEGEYQQLLFVAQDAQGRGSIYKEYWLSRREPRLVAQILFRDSEGEVLMRSRLADYARLGDGGPWLARRIDVDWPARSGELHMRVRTWQFKPQITPEFRAFEAPHERGKTFGKMVDIDEPARGTVGNAETQRTLR